MGNHLDTCRRGVRLYGVNGPDSSGDNSAAQQAALNAQADGLETKSKEELLKIVQALRTEMIQMDYDMEMKIQNSRNNTPQVRDSRVVGSDEEDDEDDYDNNFFSDSDSDSSMGGKRGSSKEVTDAIVNSTLDSTTKLWLLSSFTGGATDVASQLLTEGKAKSEERLNRASSAWNAPLPIIEIETPRATSMATLESWDWDVLSMVDSPSVLKQNVYTMLDTFGLIERFNIDSRTFKNFANQIEDAYSFHANPYHNFHHGLDVTHCVFMLLRTTDVVSRLSLSRLEILALLLSAFAHDVGHTGTTNSFHTKTNSELALQYNDVSVLENYHCSLLFKMLRQEKCNILKGLTSEEFVVIRSLIIGCILSTDMRDHFDMVSKLDGFLGKMRKLDVKNANVTTAERTPIRSTEASDSKGLSRDDVKFFLGVLLHSGDVNNVFKPFSVSDAWSSKLQEEFYRQGDKEREANIPISPYMDRKKPNAAQMSVNFIDFVVAPLLAPLTIAFPGLLSRADQLIENRQCWHEVLCADTEKDETMTPEAKKERHQLLHERKSKFLTVFAGADEVSDSDEEPVSREEDASVDDINAKVDVNTPTKPVLQTQVSKTPRAKHEQVFNFATKPDANRGNAPRFSMLRTSPVGGNNGMLPRSVSGPNRRTSHMITMSMLNGPNRATTYNMGKTGRDTLMLGRHNRGPVRMQGRSRGQTYDHGQFKSLGKLPEQQQEGRNSTPNASRKAQGGSAI